MVGYGREDLVSGRLRWTDLTPPEWRDRDTNGLWPELKTTGSFQPFEKEYFRKDGSRVPVLIGAATLRGRRQDQGVAFVLDLTERKRAEAEARESERRYREVQMELAHANRVATMGQLTASIAHEVNQPIAASGHQCRRPLCAGWAPQPPDLEEVRQALDRIVRDGNRAGEHHRPDPRPHQKSAAAQGGRGHQRRDPRGHCAHPRRSGEDKASRCGRSSRTACRSSKAIGSNCNR